MNIEDRWRLEDLYPDDDAFLSAKRDLERRIPALGEHEGALGRSAAEMGAALDAIAETTKDLNRLYAYASMHADGDTRVAANQGRRAEIEILWTDFSKAVSFLRPEILALDPTVLGGFLDEEPALAPHRHFLEDLMRLREHVLTPPEERIMAESGLLSGGANALFNLLNNAELPRPTVELSDGESVTLTPSEFAKRRTTTVRDDRRKLFEAYFGSHRAFQETLGRNLFQAVKGHVFRARTRRHGSCLEAALDGENIPTAVYHNLIRQTRAHLPVMHRYFGLRARALELTRPAYYDLHCPLASTPPRRYDAAEAAQLVSASLEPLGERYAEGMSQAFGERWIDWNPRPGKRSGAYASGAYDVHPYILLNYNRDYESVSTLAHELGHAMHSWFSNRSQPYPTADYTIFVAEVASTFNEALLNAHMLERAETDDERLALLASYVDGMRATLFRQTMFAEFELDIHARAERGEALTGEIMNTMYLDLVRAYHGHDEVLQVDEDYAVEWSAIPHFYYNFYVYQYSTGIVAATALAEAVLAGETGARDRYLRFLESGGSDYSLELLRQAGVDLERPEPYEATFRAIGKKLDILEELVAERVPSA